jgi:hypothetical protein
MRTNTTSEGVYATLKLQLNFLFLVGMLLLVSCSGGDGGIKTYMPDGLANCYMVTPGGSISIPITRAITIGGMDTSGEATVETLWDDNAVIKGRPMLSDSGASRMITVKTSSKQGNAVIVIKGANGTIYWSWHIWVVDYDPDEDSDDVRNEGWTWTNPNNPAYTFMDRNLGATDNRFNPASVGLMYQWGRKDPFPSGIAGAAGYAYAGYFKDEQIDRMTTTSGNERNIRDVILESIRKPATIFPGLGTNNDWLPGPSALWNTGKHEKSVFDPCPKGWRIPFLEEHDDDPLCGMDGTDIVFAGNDRSGGGGGYDFGRMGAWLFLWRTGIGEFTFGSVRHFEYHLALPGESAIAYRTGQELRTEFCNRADKKNVRCARYRY